MKFPNGKKIVSAAASAVATAVVIRSLIREFLPYESHVFLHDKISLLLSSMSSWITIIIDEFTLAPKSAPQLRGSALPFHPTKQASSSQWTRTSRSLMCLNMGPVQVEEDHQEGTGKSSLIAAIANYLKFDIYDLELTGLSSNSDLRRLVVATENRSILVMEDIDCSMDFVNRKAQTAENPNVKQGNEITLSGLLNFIDGLWSSCGEERIIIFATNHKERLDPALLRPDRMDVHIHMSYCTPCGFRTLALIYLRISEHTLFTQVEKLLLTAKVTPAEVAEQLMKTEGPETALEFLQVKEEENSNLKATIGQENESDEVEIVQVQ